MPISTQTTLLKQLRDFGLNPKDWQIKTGKKWSKVMLVHEEDTNLQFVGVIDWSTQRWQSLTLNTQF